LVPNTRNKKLFPGFARGAVGEPWEL